MCILIMIMLSEALWHNEGIITNYAGFCFHTFRTIRRGSGQVVTDFRQSTLAGTKELKGRYEAIHPLAHLCISSRIKFTDQQQIHSMELHKQCSVILILYGSKRGKVMSIKILGTSNTTAAISEGCV